MKRRPVPFLLSLIREGSLVKQILVGLVLGLIVGVVWPEVGKNLELLGNFFVSALKAVAPVLVLFWLPRLLRTMTSVPAEKLSL